MASSPTELSESLAEEAAEHEHHSMVPYLVTWLVLLVLTAATYLSAKADFGRLNLAIALVIASTKAGLVVWFFMHLRDQRGLNRIIFVVSIFMVLLLLTFTLGDVLTRFTLANPPTYPSDVRETGWFPSASDGAGRVPADRAAPSH